MVCVFILNRILQCCACCSKFSELAIDGVKRGLGKLKGDGGRAESNYYLKEVPISYIRVNYQRLINQMNTTNIRLNKIGQDQKMVEEKKELLRYQNLLSDRLRDIYQLSLEFGRVLGFIFEEDLKQDGGLAKLSEEDLDKVYQRVQARVLDENDQAQPSEGDYSQLLSNLLLLEHNAPKLYSYFRHINKDKFTSGGDLAIENLLQQSTEKHAAFRCTSLYKSYRIDEND